MGYRSEVHIAVPKKDEKKLDAIMNKHNLLKGDYPPFTKDVVKYYLHFFKVALCLSRNIAERLY